MSHDSFPDVPEHDFGRIGRRRNAGLSGLASYEDSAVRRLCSLLGRPALARLVSMEAADRTETGGVTFALLDELARFPVVLRVGRLLSVRFVTMPDLFNGFGRTPICVGFQQVMDEVGPTDRPIGLVFRWAGARTDDGKQNTIKGGRYMIAHTATTEIAPGGVKIVASPKLRGCPVITLETLEAFSRNFLDWEPLHAG